MSDIERRLYNLERIVLAMCSGQKFNVVIDKDGRPIMLGETTTADDVYDHTPGYVFSKTHEKEPE